MAFIMGEVVSLCTKALESSRNPLKHRQSKVARQANRSQALRWLCQHVVRINTDIPDSTRIVWQADLEPFQPAINPNFQTSSTTEAGLFRPARRVACIEHDLDSGLYLQKAWCELGAQRNLCRSSNCHSELLASGAHNPELKSLDSQNTSSAYPKKERTQQFTCELIQ